MGDFDEIITTFPSPLKHKQAKQNIIGQNNNKQTNTRKKLKYKDALRALIWKGLAESSPQPALAPGRLGRGAVQSGLCPQLSASQLLAPTPASHGPEPFQGVSLSAAPHLLNSYVPPSTSQQVVCGYQAGGYEANSGK